MFERFSRDAQRRPAPTRAAMKHDSIGSEHLFLAPSRPMNAMPCWRRRG
jgi:hypothetical protein